MAYSVQQGQSLLHWLSMQWGLSLLHPLLWSRPLWIRQNRNHSCATSWI